MKREVYKRVDVGYILNSIEPEINKISIDDIISFATKAKKLGANYLLLDSPSLSFFDSIAIEAYKVYEETEEERQSRIVREHLVSACAPLTMKYRKRNHGNL